MVRLMCKFASRRMVIHACNYGDPDTNACRKPHECWTDLPVTHPHRSILLQLRLEWKSACIMTAGA